MMNSDYFDYIGCDETGVGDFYTPIVFVAAYIPKENIQKVIDLGVRDSKKITDKKILQITPELLNYVFYKKCVLSQHGNNNLAKHLNANEVKLLYHYKNIVTVQRKVKKPAFIDQFANNLNSIKEYETNLKSHKLKFEMPLYKVEYETKAEDKVLSVAAASIIARYILLDRMKEQNEKYGMTFPLGASNKVIEFGKQFLEKYTVEDLEQVCKTNFKTFKKIIES